MSSLVLYVNPWPWEPWFTLHIVCASRDPLAEPVVFPETQGKSCTISALY